MKAGTDLHRAGEQGKEVFPFYNFHITVRGAAHLRRKVPCQDFSGSAELQDAAVVAAADGHGDIRYFRSKLGARFAVEAALKAVSQFIRCEDTERFTENTDDKLNQLKKNIIFNWNRRVARHYKANPFSEEELVPLSEKRRTSLQNGEMVESAYGTTLIASAVTRSGWFGLQIGDGDCFALMNDGVISTVPREEKLVGNVTTSLCEPDAFYSFHHIFQQKVPLAVVLSTDGVKNSFSSGEKYHSFMEKVISEFSCGSTAQTKKDLKDFLSEMTEKGSGDDVSIAGIITYKKV